ncbi:lipopolysaccharide biosynthesis protein [Flavobacteriaceae bacterium]|nr:lipopolysaccharide biosynthesis protein [Flavobacteriaceae bacterium]|tara:strand:+ start:1110 stop:2552 length:1443 start_codon:yes stop_codon:yes gene_type:complete
MQNLKQQTFNGIIWTLLDNVGVRALSFISMLFLARWLGPEEFGLVGMIAVFISLGQTLVISGMTTSLIRTKEANISDYNTVFYLNLAMSLIIYGVIYILAPYVALFYEESILIMVIRIYALVFLLTAFSAVQTTILTKQMAFKKLTLLSMPSTIIGVIVGLYMGYNGYGVWSIVGLYLTTEFIRTMLLWVFADWKPALHFSIEKFKTHYGFGYKLMLSAILDTVFQNMYNIIIGKFFSARTLGYFERSKRFCEYPSASFTGIMLKVTYPMLSKLQDEPERLAKIYRKILRISFFIIAPIMLGGAALAEPLFEVILGPEWKPAILFFQILCLSMMLYPIHAFNLNILNVYGRSDLFLKLEIIKKSISVVSILIGLQFGILGLVWSTVFTSFVALGVNMYYSSKIINYSIKKQLADLTITLIIAIGIAIVMFGLQDYLYSTGRILQLIITSFVGVLLYIGVNYINKQSPLHEAVVLIKTRNL